MKAVIGLNVTAFALVLLTTGLLHLWAMTKQAQLQKTQSDLQRVSTLHYDSSLFIKMFTKNIVERNILCNNLFVELAKSLPQDSTWLESVQLDLEKEDKVLMTVSGGSLLPEPVNYLKEHFQSPLIQGAMELQKVERSDSKNGEVIYRWEISNLSSQNPASAPGSTQPIPPPAASSDPSSGGGPAPPPSGSARRLPGGH